MSDATDDRRARGLERLKELGDHPGGDAFLERMGEPMSTWLVDWVFGDVHARPNLSPRERELIILALLTGLGSSDPQVAAHIDALRAIDVPDSDIEEAILQTAPYTGIPRAINALKVLRDRSRADEGRPLRRPRRRGPARPPRRRHRRRRGRRPARGLRPLRRGLGADRRGVRRRARRSRRPPPSPHRPAQA